MVPTTVPGSPRGPVSYEIESSKEDYVNEEDQSPSHLSLLRQGRRFNKIPRNQVTSTSTTTVFAFSSLPIKRAITPVNPPVTGQNGVLLCIPPGYVICWLRQTKRMRDFSTKTSDGWILTYYLIYKISDDFFQSAVHIIFNCINTRKITYNSLLLTVEIRSEDPKSRIGNYFVFPS